MLFKNNKLFNIFLYNKLGLINFNNLIYIFNIIGQEF